MHSVVRLCQNSARVRRIAAELSQHRPRAWPTHYSVSIQWVPLASYPSWSTLTRTVCPPRSYYIPTTTIRLIYQKLALNTCVTIWRVFFLNGVANRWLKKSCLLGQFWPLLTLITTVWLLTKVSLFWCLFTLNLMAKFYGRKFRQGISIGGQYMVK